MLLCFVRTAMPSARSAARLQSAAKYVDTPMTPAYLVVAERPREAGLHRRQGSRAKPRKRASLVKTKDDDLPNTLERNLGPEADAGVKRQAKMRGGWRSC
jgi:hypothetical protein